MRSSAKQESGTETRTIVVAEDEPDIREFLAEILSREGYDVVLTDNGDDAFAAYMAHRPDIVLSDIVMPGMDGTELLRNIKNHNRNQVVIIFSSFDKPVESLRLKADDYIAKPVNKNELLHRLRINIENHDMRRHLERMDRLRQRISFLEAEWRSFGSHEYNTRLNAISNMVELATEELRKIHSVQDTLRDEVDGDTAGKVLSVEQFLRLNLEEPLEYLSIVTAQIQQSIREGELFREYFGFSEKSLNMEKIDVNTLLSDFVRLGDQFIEQHGRRDISLILDESSPQAASAAVRADRESILHRVLREFLINACRHSKNSPVKLKAESDGKNVTIRMTDFGDGIEEQYFEKVFLPRTFAHNYLHHSSVDRNPLEYGKSGHGMGLAFARRVADLHGGKIGFESSIGTGSSFYIILPQAEVSP